MRRNATDTERRQYWHRLSPEQVKSRKKLHARQANLYWCRIGFVGIFSALVTVAVPLMLGRSDAIYGLYSSVQ